MSMNRSQPPPAREDGFTLAELMVAAAISSMILAVLLLASVSLQRSLTAIDDYTDAQGDQMRLSDFVALDLRRAYAVSTAPSTGTEGGVTVTNLLSLTLPAYYNYAGGVTNTNGSVTWPAYTPTLNRRKVVYGPTGSSVQITYFKKGSELVRREVGQTHTNDTVLADEVADFSPFFDPTTSGDVIRTQVTFEPQFQLGGRGNLASRTASSLFNRTFLRAQDN